MSLGETAGEGPFWVFFNGGSCSGHHLGGIPVEQPVLRQVLIRNA